MIYIRKQVPPTSLEQLRLQEQAKGSTPAEAYKQLGKHPHIKDELRESLMHEQGHLCAYCMKRISNTMVYNGVSPIIIEHLFPRNPVPFEDRNQGLDYNNLVLSCSGNKAPKSMHHRFIDLTCDAHKGNATITVDPTKEDTLSSICYRNNGEIHSTNTTIEKDLTKTLNLNCTSANLVSSRKAALDALIDEIVTLPEEEQLEYCQIYLDHYKSYQEYKDPFAGILIWWLEDYLK